MSTSNQRMMSGSGTGGLLVSSPRSELPPQLLPSPASPPPPTAARSTPASRVPSRTTNRAGTSIRPRLPTIQVLKTQATILLTPAKPSPDPPPGYKESLWAVVKASWLNLLLVCIPIGWAMHFTSVSPVIVFVFNFLAIIPLAKLLAFATEELALRVGQVLGGLLNATLGNAVELIVAIIALAQCQLTIVQSSLVGSILSNLLLVLGMCFFAGGTRYSEQGFLVTPAQMNSTLLVLSVIAVLLPAAFHMAISASNSSDNSTADDVPAAVQGADILQMSHGVAVILLVIYACNLIFTLWSHANVMSAVPVKSTRYPARVHIIRRARGAWARRHPSPPEKGNGNGNGIPALPAPVNGDAVEGAAATAALGGQVRRRQTGQDQDDAERGEAQPEAEEEEEEELEEEEPEEEPEYPTVNFPVTIGLLAVVTVLVGVTAEFLVSSIDGVTSTGAISEEWVGLILLPIVGNAAEHVTAVTVSVKNKLDLSIGVAVGSSIQIALFVIPFMVVLAWIMGKPLTMLFDPFESVVLFLAVLTVNYVVGDGKSNWLEGMILMNLYAIVAVSFWFYPGYNPTTALGLTC